MEVVGPGHCPTLARGSAVTIGAYDGVHLGHRALLGRLRELAVARDLLSVVVTFDRHPATVVRPNSAPAQLTDLDQRLELLEQVGIDRVYVVPFDEARSKESAEDFVQEVLVDDLAAQVVVVGRDFHFGHERSGNVALLTRLGLAHGFETESAEVVTGQGAPISSTRIRGLVAAGAVHEAAALLGRCHEVRGPVVHGDGRGGPELGFPTANLELAPDIALPAVGVYAGWYRRPDGDRMAAINVGFRPTFDVLAERPLVEAHLLDTDLDLYGETARVAFVERLRDEERYDSVAALIAQMGRDVEATRRLLVGTTHSRTW
jgi:riboflavin kinase / FMN adenylyltransferase